jgi:hypothetical protein
VEGVIDEHRSNERLKITVESNFSLTSRNTVRVEDGIVEHKWNELFIASFLSIVSLAIQERFGVDGLIDDLRRNEEF